MNKRILVDNRLVYLRDKEEVDGFWDDHWSDKQIQSMMNLSKELAIDEYEEVFGKYLTKDMLIVEAGCGPCRILNALILNGYQCFGIDYSVMLLQRVKKLRNDFQLAQMDVNHLALADSSCDACISLGVMEHFIEGVQKPLAEAKRVLKKDGVIFLQVPHFNALRRILGRCGFFKRVAADQANWRDFYQYALTQKEIRELLRSNNFELLGERYFRVMKGLKDEIPFLKKLYNYYRKLSGSGIILKILVRPLGYFLRLIEILAHTRYIRNKVSHMMMFVAVKK